MTRNSWALPYMGIGLYVGIGVLMSYVTHDAMPIEGYLGSVALFYALVAVLASDAAKIKQSTRRRGVIASILVLGFVYNVVLSGDASVVFLFYKYPYYWTYIISATIYYHVLNWAASRDQKCISSE